MNYILGVINKTTNTYENIVFVDKANKYKCIGCDSDLILRKGEIRFQSFVHKNTKGCNYFKNPTPDQLLNDSKMHLRVLLEQNRVDIFRKCKGCKQKYKLELPKYDETKSVKFDVGTDVVYLDENNNTIYGFKMYRDDSGKEPIECEWLQINMLGLIQRCVLSFATKKIELVCYNKIICSECSKYFNE
jgi:hypothetical protein